TGSASLLHRPAVHHVRGRAVGGAAPRRRLHGTGGQSGGGVTIGDGGLGTIDFAMHVVGIRILEYALTQAGCRVVNIGSQSSQQECIEAALETTTDAILVSSVYGLGEIDCRGFGDTCHEAGLANVVRYVGGNLVVTSQIQEWEEVAARCRAMGFDRV